MVAEEKELFASNDVSGDWRADLWTWSGRFFCKRVRSLPSPLDALTGDVGGAAAAFLLAVVGLLYRSRLAVYGSVGGAAVVCSRRLAIFLTVPGGREGSSTGLERALFSGCECSEAAGPEAERN